MSESSSRDMRAGRERSESVYERLILYDLANMNSNKCMLDDFDLRDIL
jgi:hypothetical protein